MVRADQTVSGIEGAKERTLTQPDGFLMIPVGVTLRDFILAKPWTHLTDLGAQLIVFAPELLRSDSMEVASTFLVIRPEFVDTAIQVVVDVQRVDGEKHFSNCGSMGREEGTEAGKNMDGIGAIGVISKYIANAVPQAHIQ